MVIVRQKFWLDLVFNFWVLEFLLV